jgi:hypothetical protein
MTVAGDKPFLQIIRVELKGKHWTLSQHEFALTLDFIDIISCIEYIKNSTVFKPANECSQCVSIIWR